MKGWRLGTHLFLGAALAFPDMGGHYTLHLLPKTRVLLELEKGRRESHVHTGPGHQAPKPHLSTGTQGCGVGDMHGNTGQAKKRALEPQEADGTKPRPLLSPNCGF